MDKENKHTEISMKDITMVLDGLENIGVTTNHPHYKVVEDLRAEHLKLEEIRKIYDKYTDALGTGDDFVYLFNDVGEAIMGDEEVKEESE